MSNVCAGATFFSFAVALLYVLLELLVYNTISLSKAAQPLIVAGKPMLGAMLRKGQQCITCHCARGNSLAITITVFKHAVMMSCVNRFLHLQGFLFCGWVQGGITTQQCQMNQSKLVVGTSGTVKVDCLVIDCSHEEPA